MTIAFADLHAAHSAIVRLADVRMSRPWTVTEFDSYLRLALAEQLAMRDYVEARREFDRDRRRRRTREVDG
jgi:hypothetical protein